MYKRYFKSGLHDRNTIQHSRLNYMRYLPSRIYLPKPFAITDSLCIRKLSKCCSNLLHNVSNWLFLSKPSSNENFMHKSY
jgi:hypothetical protein